VYEYDETANFSKKSIQIRSELNVGSIPKEEVSKDKNTSSINLNHKIMKYKEIRREMERKRKQARCNDLNSTLKSIKKEKYRKNSSLPARSRFAILLPLRQLIP
jgi:hypothetical protein